MDSKKASFLIAMPNLQESIFTHSLILLAENTAEGALGFIVNQDSGAKLAQALKLLELESLGHLELPLLIGGPVQTDFFWLIHEPTFIGQGTMRLHSDLFLSPASDVLGEAPEERPLVYQAGVGYAGWGPGQLDREIEEGAWWHAQLGLDLLFETPLEQRWEQAFESLGAHVEHLVDPQGRDDSMLN